MPRPDLDPFDLLAQRLRKLVYFGDVEVTAAVSGGHYTSTINELSTASVELDLDLIGGEPVDYLSTLNVTFEQGGYRQNMLDGAVVSVELEGSTARISARAAPAMTELLMGGGVVENATAPDVVHAIAREAGFTEDRLNIHGLDEVPSELFEVVVPVSEITVMEPRKVGPAWLVPRSEGVNALAGFDLDEAHDLRRDFVQADSYLLAIVEARLLYYAETKGLETVDLALAWLATRGRYGTAVLPDGRGQPFSRARALTSPTRGTVVLIRGLLTRRRWLRRPTQLLKKELWAIDDVPAMLEPRLPDDVSVSDRQALTALHRAISEVDQVARAQSLWQAIEAYAVGTRVPRLFSKPERQRLADSIPEDLNNEQRERLTTVYKDLNLPPLMERLQARLAADAVPVSEGEMALLDRLRDVRNDVTHGREPRFTPGREELEHAISIVSRMLVYGIDPQ